MAYIYSYDELAMGDIYTNNSTRPELLDIQLYRLQISGQQGSVSRLVSVFFFMQ